MGFCTRVSVVAALRKPGLRSRYGRATRAIRVRIWTAAGLLRGCRGGATAVEVVRGTKLGQVSPSSAAPMAGAGAAQTQGARRGHMGA